MELNELFWDIIAWGTGNDDEFWEGVVEPGSEALAEWDVRPALRLAKLNWAWN